MIESIPLWETTAGYMYVEFVLRLGNVLPGISLKYER